MAQLTLIRPPQVSAIGGLEISKATPNIGLAYLAAAAQAAGHSVKIIDAVAEAIDTYHKISDSGLMVNGLSFEEIIELIPETSTVIGITFMFSNEWFYAKDLVSEIKLRFPNSLLIAGGEHITADPFYSMKSAPAIDLAVCGEGEETLLEILDLHDNNLELREIFGTVYKTHTDEFIKAPPRKRIKEIDEIPWPLWDQYPIESYLTAGQGFNRLFGRPMPLLASRGCPYQCTFCSSPKMWTTRWQARNPKDVVDEIKHYIEKYKVNHIEFYDLTAIIKKSWILEFCDVLIREEVKISWTLPSGTRSEALDQPVLKKLKEAGCESLTYAPESGSPATLRRIKKKVKIDRMLSSIRAAHKSGIRVKANIIFGFPGDTLRDAAATYKFLFQCALAGMQDVAIFSFMPYPGSELYEELRTAGKVPTEDRQYTEFLTGNMLGKFDNQSWNENLSDRALRLVIIGAVVWFYSWSILFRPHRGINNIVRVLRGVPKTTLEMLIHNFFAKKART